MKAQSNLFPYNVNLHYRYQNQEVFPSTTYTILALTFLVYKTLLVFLNMQKFYGKILAQIKPIFRLIDVPLSCANPQICLLNDNDL